MTRPSIEQLRKNFLDMDIPSVGDEDLLGTARRLDNYFRLWEKGNHSPDMEDLIRQVFANVEAQYAATLYQPAYSFEHECGMGMQEPDVRHIPTDTFD